MGGLGGNPEKLRLLDQRSLGVPMPKGVDGRVGNTGGLVLVDCDMFEFKFCEWPGQAAPGKEAASAMRVARAAEIALRLAEPRSLGADGLLLDEHSRALAKRLLSSSVAAGG